MGSTNRPSGHRRRVQHPVSNDAEPAWQFGDEEIGRAGQEGVCQGCTSPLANVVTAIRTSSPGLQPPCRAPIAEQGPGV
jgi:hypothetical protein